MKTTTRILLSAALGFAPGLWPTTHAASAAGVAAGGKMALTERIVWYDGDQQRSAWVNPTLVAEFPRPGAENEASALHAANPAARLVSGRQGAVRLWHVESGSIARRATAQVAPEARLSPVLHEGNSADGRMRALPGDVVVRFKPEWTEAQIQAWAQANGHVLGKRMPLTGNVYLIRTDAGLVSVEVANTIHRSGEVIYATPNWWQQMGFR